MAGPQDHSIADDSAQYEDLAEGTAKVKSPGGSAGSEPGLSEDSALYEDLVPAGEDALTLDASWLYKHHGQVFGPVSSKALLEKLYAGELDAETPIAPQDGDFMALRRYGAFRLHLPKAEEHRVATAEVKRKETAAKRAKVRNWVLFGVAMVLLSGGVGFTVIQSIRTQRLEEAERVKAEKEKKIKEEMIESLMASLTIEPPLVEIVEDEKPEEGVKKGKKKGGKRIKVAGAALPPTVELTRGEIMEGVAQIFGGLKRCIVEQIQRDPESVSDRISLSFSVNNDGIIQNFEMGDRGLRKAPIKDCIGGKLAQLRFRKYIGEVQNVEYPITIGGRR